MTISRRVSHQGLADKAYSFIRAEILRGELHMGSVLSRPKLAKQIGTSIFPISEAIQRLEAEGLLESKPQVGTRVRVPSETDIRECYIIREALECQSARLVAGRATFEQREELNRMAENVDALFNRQTAGDSDAKFAFAVQDYHLQLHMKIAEYSACAALANLLEKNSLLVLNWIFDIALPEIVRPARLHRDLVRVVTGNSADAAEAAMRQHVRIGLDSTIQAVARFDSKSDGRWRIRDNAPKYLSKTRKDGRRPSVDVNCVAVCVPKELGSGTQRHNKSRVVFRRPSNNAE
jgi:GntR family transcriptional regulator, rspAB operon transcriptional repressor